MLYYYPVLVKKTDTLPSFIIPDLDNLKLQFTEQQLTDIGMRKLLQKSILSKLNQKMTNDEDITPPKFFGEHELPEYDLYILSDFSEIQPKKISHPAIMLVNKENKLTAYFIENNSFIKHDEAILSVELPLSGEDVAILLKQQRNAQNKIEETDDNAFFLGSIIAKAASAAKRQHLDLNDSWTLIPVEFSQTNRTQCCTNFLPVMTKVTLILELLAGFPLMCTMMMMSQEEMIEDQVGLEVLSIAQTTLLTLLIIFMTFAGPAAKTLGSFGEVFDDFFHKANRFLCGHKPKSVKDKEKEKCCTTNHIKKGLAKAAGSLLVLNLLYLNVSSDYQQINSITERATQIDSIFPKWLLLSTSWIQFGFNQLNDPVLFFSFLKFIFNVIDDKFRPKLTMQDAIATEKKPAPELKSTQKTESKDDLSTLNFISQRTSSEDTERLLEEATVNSEMSDEDDQPSKSICLLM